jgi:hypothetical protein
LKLACSGVVAEKSCTSCVKRLGLHVFVKVGRCNGTDPVVATLERGARSRSCWRTGRGRSAGDSCSAGPRSGCRGLGRGNERCDSDSRLALRVVFTVSCQFTMSRGEVRRSYLIFTQPDPAAQYVSPLQFNPPPFSC